MEPSTDLLHAVTYRFLWGDISNATCFTAPPPPPHHIYLLTNHSAISAQVTEILNMDLDERIIGGGYNTMSLIEIFKDKMNTVVKKKLFVEWGGVNILMIVIDILPLGQFLSINHEGGDGFSVL